MYANPYSITQKGEIENPSSSASFLLSGLCVNLILGEVGGPWGPMGAFSRTLERTIDVRSEELVNHPRKAHIANQAHLPNLNTQRAFCRMYFSVILLACATPSGQATYTIRMLVKLLRWSLGTNGRSLRHHCQIGTARDNNVSRVIAEMEAGIEVTTAFSPKTTDEGSPL